ncbi:MAG TPA: 1-acyl-sn-glycerol-3-phosphate acyltransferase [Bacteroidales bacterium]|nr:1-acyl-sn-glycerol-3-phosphate acyltransferase [Bacteroidales bacterium]
MVRKQIDIYKIIRNSNSRIIRSLPHFVVRLMEKIIHQDEMNATISRNDNKKGIPFVNGILEEWNVKIKINGGDNVPSSGRFVFAANHPVGAIDSLSLLSAIALYYPDVISPSNELFNYIPHLRPLILGVNVFGRNTKETAEKLNSLFASDKPIMIFPSGEVSRRHKGKIEDPAWQKSFITKSISFKRDIIPIHISGRNSGFFYFIANARKSLGIKTYLETILLPREMMKQHNTTVEISFGKPIGWQTFTSDKSHQEWAQYVKDIVYKIGNIR